MRLYLGKKESAEFMDAVVRERDELILEAILFRRIWHIFKFKRVVYLRLRLREW